MGHDAANHATLKWSVDCEDGVFPEPDGVGDMQLIYEFGDIKD